MKQIRMDLLLTQRRLWMGNKVHDPISDALNIEPAVEVVKTKTITVLEKEKHSDDYEYARRNLYDVIEKGQSALEDIVDIARQSESARAFEVAANLMKTMVEANKDLLELAKKKKELETVVGGPDKQVTNNNLFVGSSADLLRLMKQKTDE